MIDAFPTFLAVVAGACVLVIFVCILIKMQPCDHEWEEVDDSFDHEYGTEQIHFRRCVKCGEETEVDRHDDGPVQGEDY